MPELLLLGCSQRKTQTIGPTPALHRYDGPIYQDFRSRLRTHVWPRDLHVAVLSAEYGVIGALTEITDYDRRMTHERARELAPRLAQDTAKWLENYDTINLCLGRDYLNALPTALQSPSRKVDIFEGPIGIKRQRLGEFLRGFKGSGERHSFDRNPKGRLAYFLPDWDDLIDPGFDFQSDSFSGAKADRNEVHCARLMRPYKIADGILVSLAQKRDSKGPLKYVGGLDARTMQPIDLRGHYGMSDTQALFGDCGAFSYVNEPEPPFSSDYAVSLYDLYNFDFGASIDHIPVPFVQNGNRKRILTQRERKGRVDLTTANAEDFLNTCRRKRTQFQPVGIVQGLSPEQYALNACLYAEMGYQRIALGGLVPLADSLVQKIVSKTMKALRSRKSPPEVHLFGIFRPKLQSHFLREGVASFDSATYFRKAWLRSEQNYFGYNGKWYAAIRVPMTSDGRTRNIMEQAGHDLAQLAELESEALDALHKYGRGKVSLRFALSAITIYDQKLDRSSEDTAKMAARYERTLAERPWQHCPCPICKKTGIDVLIFRGSNRNKRRGAHNTWRLYQAMRSTRTSALEFPLDIRE